MTLFCDGAVVLPEHVVFPPDLEPDRATSEVANSFPTVPRNDKANDAALDLSMQSAMKRHVRFVYEQQANQNQRRAAKMLGISRSTLARYLRDVVKK
jgi:transcriptional regulator with PAS, ATPase and Fis domain